MLWGGLGTLRATPSPATAKGRKHNRGRAKHPRGGREIGAPNTKYPELDRPQEADSVAGNGNGARFSGGFLGPPPLQGSGSEGIGVIRLGIFRGQEITPLSEAPLLERTKLGDRVFRACCFERNQLSWKILVISRSADFPEPIGRPYSYIPWGTPRPPKTTDSDSDSN